MSRCRWRTSVPYRESCLGFTVLAFALEKFVEHGDAKGHRAWLFGVISVNVVMIPLFLTFP